MPPELRIIGVQGLPEVQPGDDLGLLIVEGAAQGTPLADGDVLVVSQKVVSKAEGRVVDLRQVEASPFARHLGSLYDKDPRIVELILDESRRIVRMDRGVLITETHHGFVCANAGVDASNIPDDDTVSLLPRDPDASARLLRQGVKDLTGHTVAVIVCDSFGRPWREGATNVAIGVAGTRPLLDYRGQVDRYGRLLQVSVSATADELAGAGELVMAKTGAVPVALVRGLDYEAGPDSAAALLRDPSTDMFR